MKLKKNSFLIWLAYWPDTVSWLNKPEEIQKAIPEQTDLCTVLGNAFLRGPIFALFLAAFGIIFLAAGVIYSPFWLIAKITKRPQIVIDTWLKDVKNKTCTRVDIEP